MQLLNARRLGRGHDEDEIRDVLELAATPRGAPVPVRDGGDGVRLLRGDAAGGCRQAVQRLLDPRDLRAHFTASTKASRSPWGPSSTTVPMTTKSAPAFRAARACAGVRMPPPTNRRRDGTAARQARITSVETGCSAPLPASR